MSLTVVDRVLKDLGGLHAEQKAHFDSNSLSKVNDALPTPPINILSSHPYPSSPAITHPITPIILP
jgi:hypothetical protein